MPRELPGEHPVIQNCSLGKIRRLQSSLQNHSRGYAMCDPQGIQLRENSSEPDFEKYQPLRLDRRKMIQ